MKIKVVEIKKRFMIVRIVNMISESCYEIVEKDYETLGSAWGSKEKYENPQHYIVVQYYQ